MKQCQLSEIYRYDESKKEIKMPYNYDTSSLYSKYNKNYIIWYNILNNYDDYLDLNVLIATISMVKFLKVGQCYHKYVR